MDKPPINSAFLPTCKEDMVQRGWNELDILFVCGDAYIDHPAFGVPLLARLLEAEGYRVGVLSQPDWRGSENFKSLGRPRLFAAISSGAMDSMVNHYTASKKVRKNDAYSPGGRTALRPNRATIAYTAAIKGAFKGLPTVIGGIEASLRRLAHYDYWDDKVRRSILIDSKADLLIYGMAEKAIVSVAQKLSEGIPIHQITDVKGTAYVSLYESSNVVKLPAFEEVSESKDAYNKGFRLTVQQASPFSGRALSQRHGNRFVIVNPPDFPMCTPDLDRVYALPFTKLPHPDYHEPIPAFEQIRFSITSHRGCFGGCAFCAIASHQGKTIQSRSRHSIREEVERLSQHPLFRGTITDVGGPTANMYGLGCKSTTAEKRCRRQSCLFPEPCPHLKMSGQAMVALLNELRELPAVNHLFIASGLRFDLLEHQTDYFDDILRYHVGGLLKVAPESTSPVVTQTMRKPGPHKFSRFLETFHKQKQFSEKRLGMVPYFMSGHPGCTLEDMVEVALFLKRNHLFVEQVQEFTPTPGTLATCLYHTGKDPFTGKPVYIPRSTVERQLQKSLLLWHLPESRKDVTDALRRCGRQDAMHLLIKNDRTIPKHLKNSSHRTGYRNR